MKEKKKITEAMHSYPGSCSAAGHNPNFLFPLVPGAWAPDSRPQTSERRALPLSLQPTAGIRAVARWAGSSALREECCFPDLFRTAGAERSPKQMDLDGEVTRLKSSTSRAPPTGCLQSRRLPPSLPHPPPTCAHLTSRSKATQSLAPTVITVTRQPCFHPAHISCHLQ